MAALRQQRQGIGSGIGAQERSCQPHGRVLKGAAPFASFADRDLVRLNRHRECRQRTERIGHRRPGISGTTIGDGVERPIPQLEPVRRNEIFGGADIEAQLGLPGVRQLNDQSVRNAPGRQAVARDAVETREREIDGDILIERTGRRGCRHESDGVCAPYADPSFR